MASVLLDAAAMVRAFLLAVVLSACGGSLETSGGMGGGSATGGGGTMGGGGGGGATMHTPQDTYALLCASCHAADGSGVATAGPAIQRASTEMVAYLVRKGDQNQTRNPQNQVVGDARTMAAYDATLVSDADLAGITTWLQSLPAATTGATLFAQSCSYCHGVSGKGGATEYVTAYHSAPFVRQTQATFRAYVKAGHTSENGATIDPSDRRAYMPPFASLLTDAQLDLIYTWAQAQ